LAETLKLNLTGFYEFFQNELVTQSPGAGLQSFTFNAPESEHRGFEARLDWRPQPGWRLWLAYLFDDQVYTRYTEQLSAGTRTAAFNRAGKKIPGGRAEQPARAAVLRSAGRAVGRAGRFCRVLLARCVLHGQ